MRGQPTASYPAARGPSGRYSDPGQRWYRRYGAGGDYQPDQTDGSDTPQPSPPSYGLRARRGPWRRWGRRWPWLYRTGFAYPPPFPPPPPPPEAPDAAPPDVAPVPVAAPPPDAGAAPDAGPPDAAPPADGARADGDAAAAAPPDAAGAAPEGGDSAGELSFGDLGRRDQGEQEFVLNGPCSVEARTQPKVPLTLELTGVAEEPGVYVIYVNNDPWYVGVAEEGIRKRFLHRLKVLRDLRLPSTVLQGRFIQCIPLVRATVGRQALSRRLPGGTASPLTGKNAILKVLEQLYIKKMGTIGRGNKIQERVIIDSKGGSLSVEVDGQPVRLPLKAYKSKSGQVLGQAF